MTQPRINTEQVQYILSHKVVFEDFDATKQYAPSNLIKYGDNLYLSKNHIEPGSFNPSEWWKLYNSDDVDSLIQQIHNLVDDEEARAKAAEALLQANINAEEQARIRDDGILQDNIDAEEQARIEQDVALQTALGEEVDRATEAEETLQDNIDAEVTRATGVEAQLQSNITAEENRATTAEEQLQHNINAEETRAKAAETSLQDNIDAEAEARTLADNDLRDLIEETGGDLDAEVARAKAAEALLQSNIDTVQTNLDNENARAIAREDEIEASSIQESIVPNVVKDIELVQENVLLALKKTTQDTNTGNTTVTQTPFQMVNENRNGMMTKEAYNQIYNNDSRIATLEGASKRYPTHLGTGSHTQAEYQAEWERLSGNPAGTTPPDGSTLVNLDNNHAITYFANAEGDKWIDRGIDTVSLATQSTPGIVKGSLDNGKIYAEADGTMSLNGYDALVAADANLDSRLTQEVADRIADVDAEETRAKGIESGLRTDLTSEISRATTAENAENTRALAAEANLQSQIDDLDSDLADEISARTTGDANLNTYIGNVETALNTEISDRIADVNAEETRAKGVEANLQSQIDDVVSDLATEATTRGDADIALQSNIDKEVQDRKDAVEAEELARKTADSLLSDSIGNVSNALATEISRATDAESALDTKIDGVAGDLSDEVTRATTAEETLQDNIDTVSGNLAQEILDRVADVNAEETRAKGVEANLQSQIDTVAGDLAQEVTDRTDADAGLQSQIDDLETDLSAEVSRATTAETTLGNRITGVAGDLSDEVTRATGVESNLQDQIDDLDGATSQLETDLAAETLARTNADNTLQGNIDTVSGNLTQEISNRVAAVKGVRDDLDAHTTNTSNPHSVTKAQVGLGNVDNTSDLSKPISTATQTALNLKADKSYTDTELAKKQDTLVSGTNIKTINNESLLGSSNISLQTKLSGTKDNVVIYTDTTGTLDELGFDSVPTQNGKNLLRSGVVWEELRKKINFTDIVNDVVTGGVSVPLSAEQGKELNTKINMAMQSTHDRGVVLNALTSQEQNYSITNATVNNGGTNYVVGDTLMLTSDLYVDGIIIVSSVNSSGAITGIHLGQAGAFSTNPSGTSVSFIGGSGSGATFNITASLVNNKTLLDIANPQQNDFATVLQDEIHNNLRFVWKYADLDGDGNYEWVSGYPITTEERNFTEDPIKSTELASNAVVTEKIADNNITRDKLANNSIISRHVTDGTILDRHVGDLAAIKQSKIEGLVDALASKASADNTYTKTEVDNLLDDKLDITDASSTYATITNLNAHTSNTSNPHSVTKAQVGLGNVDNTSDLNKPISTATQDALNLKADKSTTYTKTQVDDALDLKLDKTEASSTYATITNLNAHTSNTSNPHNVTKAQVGLGNVDNTSDANKPISTATQTALDGKVSKAGDKMTGNLELISGSLYLEGIGSSVAASTSRINLGTPTSVYAYLTGNTSGAFGIYSEHSGTRTGIACYPGQNFFADATTKTMDLGRSNNVWKIGYINSLSNGTNSITIADIITAINTTLPTKADASSVYTKTQVDGFLNDKLDISDAEDTYATITDLSSHTSNTSNPHNVTKAQVGLGNVDNTSDLSKPISTATQTALNAKADQSNTYTKQEVDDLIAGGGVTYNGAVTTILNDNLFPGRVVVSDSNGKVGISGISSTELGTLSGISSNIQNQINAKADASTTYSKTDVDDLLDDKADKSTTYTKTQVDTSLGTKVDKVSTANKVYGTNASGAQTTYDVNSFGQVDDVKVGSTSVVSNKIASLGTMAGESADDYSTTAEANDLYAEKSLETAVSNHINNTSNPHSVTKAQVGLGNVDNTSDANKPVSTAQQTALNLKADKSNTYTKTEVDNAISAAIDKAVKYKGTVANYSDLPTSGNVIGDMWNITNADSSHGIKAGDNVVWNGTGWDNQGGTIDLSNYYTKSQTYSKTEVDNSLNLKADKSTTYTKTEVDDLIDDLDENKLDKTSVGLIVPDTTDMTVLQTYTLSLSDTNYHRFGSFTNNATKYSDIKGDAIFRMTITGTNIDTVIEGIISMRQKLESPYIVIRNRCGNASAATSGIRYIRSVYPKALNNNYNWEFELSSYNATARTVVLEILKNDTGFNWGFANSTYDSTYQSNASLSAYTTDGIIGIPNIYWNANTSSSAGYITSYLPLVIPGTMPVSGEALLAGQLTFMNANKIYPATNNSNAIEPGYGIQYNATALAVNTAVAYTSLRQKGSVTSLTNIPHATIAKGNPLYFRCHLDSNGNIISDNYIDTSMKPGYTWYYMGIASSSSAIMIDTTRSKFLTLNNNGKLTHIDGQEIEVPITIDAYTKSEIDAMLLAYRTSSAQDTIDSGKADKYVPSTAGNIAILTTDGNLSDGGTLGSLAHLSSITESNISGTLSQSKITNLTTDLSTINTTLGNKANSADVYTKTQTYSKTEVDTALSGKQNTLTAGDNITIVNNTISATTAMVKFRDWYDDAE